MRDYVTLFAFAADGPYCTAGVYNVAHAEAAIDKARATCAEALAADRQPTVFVAIPLRNWTANEFEQELVTRRREAAAPAAASGIRQVRASYDPPDADDEAPLALATDAGHSVKVAAS